jgi:hypothetical protein
MVKYCETTIIFLEVKMAEVIVHEMKYYGGKVNSDIDVVNYSDEYYNDYRSIGINHREHD